MSVRRLLHLARLRQLISCLLVFALLPVGIVQGQTASTIVLSAAATPAAAELNVTTVSVTGDGFPSGSIAPSAVTVHLSPAALTAGPAMVAVASAVTTLFGTSRRITFQVAPANPSNNPQIPTAYQVSVSGTSAGGVSFSSSNTAALTINPPASVQSVSPATAAPAQTLSVTITGVFSNFFQGSTVASFGPDISVGGAAAGAFGPVTAVSATSVIAQVALSPTATAGVREVDVRTGLELAILPNGFTIEGTPVLTQANPGAGQQGQQNLSVALTGQFTHFVQGITTASFGAGITVASLSVNSAASATAVLNIGTTAAAGVRNVTVTTGLETVTLTNGFTVANGTPVLTQVSPNTGQQGQQNVSVALTGQFTHFVQGTTTASFGAGITVASLSVSSATSATALLNISATASAGSRGVSLTTGGEAVTLSNGFTVTNGTPVLTQVSPNTGQQGQQNVSVALTGQFTHFVQGTTTALFGAGITVASLSVSSATSATALLNISPTAMAGSRDVSLATGGEVVTLSNGFTVANGTPVLAQVSPNTGQPGQQNVSVALTGQFTHFVQGTTTASFGAGITVASVTANSATSATAVLNIDTTAAAGVRDVVVTTGTEAITLSGGFSVTDGTPVLTRVNPNSGQQGIVTAMRAGILDFDSPPAGLTPNYFVQGSPVGASSHVTNQFQNLGVIFSTSGGAPYAALIDLTGQAPSGTNGIGSVNSAGYVDYTQDLDISLVVPGTTTPALTDFISIQGDEAPLPGNVIFSAYDINGNLLASGTQPDTAGGVYSLSACGIHEFRIHSTSGTVAYDNLTFDSPTVASGPSVDVTGQFTHFVQGTTTLSFGIGVDATSLTVTSATTATAVLNICGAASPGPRNVTATTGAEVATLANGFTVTPGTPVLTQVTPITGQQAQQNLSVALRGQFTHFVQGTTTASFGAGITVASLNVNSQTSATASLYMDPAAAVGSRDVTVTTGAEVVALANGFAVAPGTPVLNNTYPFFGQQGQQNLSITLGGQYTHFVQGTTTASFGAGITVASLTVNSSTSATAVVNISSAAVPGARNVSVTTGLEVVTQVSAFIVAAGTPVLTQVSPNMGQQGQQNLSVMVTGQSTNFVQGTTTASFGSGITVVSLVVTSATSAVAVLNIGATAVPGATNVSVTTGGEVATLANGFTVTAGTPVITGVNPNGGQQGQSNLSVTISGLFTHFTAASVVTFTGNGISAGTPILVTSTSLTVPVSVTSNAAAGARGIQVVSGTEAVSLANAFAVVSLGSTPFITSVSPPSALPTQSVQVTITGQNTHFVQGTTTANFGPGVIVGNGMAGAAGLVNVTSPTTAVAQLSIPASAALGSRTVYVSTGNEQASLTNGFTVNGTPALNSVTPWSGQQGATLTVTIAGLFTSFQQGVTVASFGSGISVGGAAPGASGPVTVTSPTSATAQIVIAANAAVGLRTLSVSSGVQQESLAGAFVVLGPVTGPSPAVNITSPTEGSTVTTLTNVAGTVTSPNLADWILEYSSSGANGFIQFAEGTGSTVNGSFDPSLLLNGMATIRLTAVDQSGQTTSTAVDVVLAGRAKVGNFTLTFTDLSIPVAGLPIQVNRTYDSRNKATGDFGFGWSLSYNTVIVQTNGIMGSNWLGTSTGGIFPTYCVQPPPNFVVSVRLQDGTVYQFSPVAATQCQQFAPLESVDIAFVPVGQTPSTAALSAPGATGLLISGIFPGRLQLIDSDTGLAFDPDQFILTLPNGETLQLSRTFGLQTVIDTKGNSLTFGPNGIVSSAGPVVSFNRDSSGRITTITDPNQNVLDYSYSAGGNLATSADARQNTSAYSYDAVHDLLSYTNPLGNQGVRNTYDDFGRLIQVTDALGHVTNFGHDPVSRIESITDALGNPTTYAYDVSGDLLSATDPLGNTFTTTYDTNGNRLTTSSPSGLILSSTYDSANNLLSQSDALGNTFMFTYNGFGQILTSTDPLGHTATSTYDAAGNLLSARDAAGNTSTTTYNAQGQPLTSTDALGNVTAYQYDTTGYLTQQTDPSGVATAFTNDQNGNHLTSSVQRTRSDGTKETLLTQFRYDAQNNLLSTTNPDGSTVSNVYDALNENISVTDAAGLVTRYIYDASGRQVQTVHPDGSATSTVFDANGNRAIATDEAGHTTSYQYDAVNNLIATTSADGSVVTSVYDAMGRVVKSVDPVGNATTFTFDAAGRQTASINALGQTTSMTYDANGNQISRTDPRNNITKYVYDALNRRTRVIYPDYPDSTFQSTSYDATGKVAAVTDQAGKTTQHSYDPLGRLASTTDAAGQVTSSTYDEVGNRISQTDASGRTTLYSYDQMGRRISRTLPLGQKETYSYDIGGNLISKADFNGRVTTYAYDSSYRLIRKTADPFFSSSHLGAAQISFTYTPDGLRTSMADGAGTTNYTYDVVRHLIQIVSPEGTLAYAYDPAGNEVSVHSTHTGGAATTYSYDELNRLHTATDASGVSTYTFDAAGNTSSLSLPNGVSTSFTYDSQNRLTAVASSRMGAAISEYDYQLEPAGHRTAVQEHSGRKAIYAYDSLYRLTDETITGAVAQNGAVDYVLDKTGNRTQIKSTVPAVSGGQFTYDSNDRLTTDVYDSDGNTTSSNGTAFAYDFENHLVKSGGIAITYDGDGNRVSKTVSGVTTSWLVDRQSPSGFPQVLEELQGGVVIRAYSYGLQLLDERQTINGSSVTSFYGFDGAGSARFLSDVNGAVTDTYAYDAFGNLLSSTGSTPNLYRFSGQQFDPDLNLYYNRARYLNPRTGRFLTMDDYEGNASDPRTIHKYVYADDNPLFFSDPGGHLFLPSTIAWGNKVHETVGNDYTAATNFAGCFDIPIFSLVLSDPLGPSKCKRVYPYSGEAADRPDLAYPIVTGFNHGGEIFEIKSFYSAAEAVAEVEVYLQLLRRYDGRDMPGSWSWHRGSSAEYQYKGVNPIPLLAGLTVANVLPAVGGVILYGVTEGKGVDGLVLSIIALRVLKNVKTVATAGRTVGQLFGFANRANSVAISNETTADIGAAEASGATF